jgi:hypothetical protein
MSSTLTAFLAVTYHKMPGKRESPIEPFVRTARLAEIEQQKAVQELKRATDTLVDTLAQKIPHGN